MASLAVAAGGFAAGEGATGHAWAPTRRQSRGWALRWAVGLLQPDLVVDLGDRVGSARWWRGFATLSLLVGGAVSLGTAQLPDVIGAVPPRATGAMQEERRADAIAPLAAGGSTGQRVAPSSLVQRLAEAPERPRIELTATVGRGGLEAALRRAGVGRADLDLLRQGLAAVRGGAQPQSGSTLDLVLGRRESRSDPRPLESLTFRAAFDLKVEVARDAGGVLRVRPVPIRVDDTPLRVTGEVGRSLVRAARAAGLPAGVVADYVRQMSHVVDLQREVGRRDRFEIVVAHRRAETGETETGQLLFAGLSGRNDIALMRWGPRGKFFRADGESAQKGLMRTPVDGARMSSGFGMRFHPILNFSRLHAGVDFAAGTGTPVLASAGGRVVRSGWGGGYGNVVMIDHGRGVMTRYAHLSKLIARPGQQVEQGQVVGQVGSTGLSTGPHLHYEVWLNGRPVDPRQAKFQAGEKLAGRDFAAFRSEMVRLRGIEPAGERTELAAAPPAKPARG
jgi:murein DD-endopeptidase MepM/ murein hydrolase activator NlpD